ncbi:carbohydrate ABC transporter permease [Ruania alba]|uniref:Raffinose/stachyose/melibiose transport system permease protein n=1 Tax=Ruania alba TaxID=648782 RepID=A0A1H5K9K9_9MICO|nr:carbohydrate ABC transporter permease [Ruania alba]SEE61340.1 raffinose/stachyose/melibiose transport system permease protein [Ruania alba]
MTTTETRRTAAPQPTRRGPRSTGAGLRRQRSMGRTGRMVTHLVLLPLVFLWVYPYAWSMVSSIRPQAETLLGGASLIPEELTWSNFERAWTQARFETYTINTVIVTLAVVFLTIAISATAGYALGRGSMPGRKVIIGTLVVTMFLPKGFTIIPVFLLIDALGVNNTLFAVILAEAGPAHIMPILLYIGYFSAIPRDLEDAARVDGAGFVRTFASVMFPMAKPVTATVAIFSFIGAWNAFLVPLVFTLNAPELRTLGVGIYAFFGEDSIDWGGLAAASVIAVVPVIVVFLSLQKYFVDGIAGSIKG